MTPSNDRDPVGIQFKPTTDRTSSFDQPSAGNFPERGEVAEAGGVRFILHPPLDFEFVGNVDAYLILSPFTRAAIDLSIGDGTIRRQSMTAGAGLVIPPGTKIQLSMVEPVEFLTLMVMPVQAESVFRSVARERSWIPDLIEHYTDPGFASLTSEIRRSLVADPLSEPAYLGALSDGICARIGCYYAGIGAHAPNGKEMLAPATLNRIIRSVEDNLSGALSVEGLAQDAGLSRSHFSRAFLATTGESPQEFIIGRRVCRARDMLSDTDAPLAEIAVKTGFSSQAHFSTAFKKRIGVTPGKYRNVFRPA